MKKVENIKDFDKLVETYAGIEKLVLNSRYQISLESSCNFITDEIINDLIVDLEANRDVLESYVFENMKLSSIITESTLKLKKAKRNKDIGLIEGVLNGLLINVINERKGIVFDGDDLLESYANNIQFIYDCEIDKYCGNNITGLIEATDKKSGGIINTIRNAFTSKHDKIVARDQQWLKDNKKKLTGMSYDGVELEVPSDYKVTFANLINKHDIFDKNFRDSGNPEDIQSKIRRFEDKSGNLKNGLDNYFRTGSARREIGLRKVSGDEAKNVVSTMIDYCKDFLSGKKLIEDKLDEISSEVNKTNKSKEESEDEVVKEYSSHLYLKDESKLAGKNKKIFKESIIYEADESNKDEKQNPKNNSDEDDDLGLEDDPIDDIDTNDGEEDAEKPEENKEEKPSEEVVDSAKIARDRQTGITVLMTIAEERYFDYIDILKSLLEE